MFNKKAPGNSVADAAIKAIKAHEKVPATPESLRKEAKQLVKSIDDYVKEIQEDLNAIASKGRRIKINLKNPKSYAKLRDDKKRTEAWDALNKLADAKGALERTVGRRGETERTNIEFARIMMESAQAFYKEAQFLNDPLRAVMGRGLDASLRTVARATPERKEVKEVVGMAKIVQLVDELIYLGSKTTGDTLRRAEIQAQLKDIANKVMVGKNRNTIRRGNLTISRAKGPGTPAFEFAVASRRKLDQGGRTGFRTVRYTERVYAGGSAKDFPKKKRA